MQLHDLPRLQHVMTTARLTAQAKTQLQAALDDALLRGFHVDVEQLRANLDRLAPPVQ